MDALAKLTEFDLKDCDEQQVAVIQHALMLLSRFMQLIAKYLKAPHLSAGGNIDDQENFDSLGGGLEAMMRYGMQGSSIHSNTLLSVYSGVSGMSGMSGSSQYQPFDDQSHRFSDRPSMSLNGISQKTMNALKAADEATSESSYGSHKLVNLPVPAMKEVCIA